jgi:hypothetical protein
MARQLLLFCDSLGFQNPPVARRGGRASRHNNNNNNNNNNNIIIYGISTHNIITCYHYNPHLIFIELFHHLHSSIPQHRTELIMKVSICNTLFATAIIAVTTVDAKGGLRTLKKDVSFILLSIYPSMHGSFANHHSNAFVYYSVAKDYGYGSDYGYHSGGSSGKSGKGSSGKSGKSSSGKSGKSSSSKSGKGSSSKSSKGSSHNADGYGYSEHDGYGEVYGYGGSSGNGAGNTDVSQDNT